MRGVLKAREQILAALKANWVVAGVPQSGFLAAQFSDQFSHVFQDRRPARLAVTSFPSPEQPEAFSMPGNDCFRLDDDQGRLVIAPNLA